MLNWLKRGSKANDNNSDGVSEARPGNSEATNAKIENDANPEPDQHNHGQPLRVQIDERGQQQSKLKTDCTAQRAESLKCIEENYTNRGVCEPLFAVYRSCRRDENERRLEENRKKGASWF
mmetsp:Transcript_14028/g.21896  ORF Transcript_14028/g.21896 Transcript_14028/m.21896 type:complete len:121 (+) Transcript_14028:291-653(+)